MEIFLIQLVLILFSARFVGEIAARLGIPSVIGELLAGVIIGPSLLNIVQPTEAIHILAQIGIILLLFEVGLETDIGKLVNAGIKALVVASAGVIIPFVLGFVASFFYFDFSFLISLFIASTLTSTSIGITIRVLSELKKQANEETQIILGAAVIDDIIGIVLLALLYEFAASGEANLWNAAKVLVFILLFLILAPLAVRLISLTIEKWEQKSDIPGLLPTMIVALIMFFAWIAEIVGAPELLGGFAAGLALSKQFHLPWTTILETTSKFSEKIEHEMQPIIHLFTPIFFVTIGLSLNLHQVDWSSVSIWTLTGVLLIAGIIGKLSSGFFLPNESFFNRLTIGIAMVPRGEVGLIFAGVGLDSGVLNQDLYTALVLVIAITTLIAPFALRWYYSREPSID